MTRFVTLFTIRYFMIEDEDVIIFTFMDDAAVRILHILQSR